VAPGITRLISAASFFRPLIFPLEFDMEKALLFEARGEDGRTVVVEASQELRRIKTLRGRSITPLPLHFATADDLEVERVEKGRYRIVTTGEQLISEDPAAP
jgi:hypothetical protein